MLHHTVGKLKKCLNETRKTSDGSKIKSQDIEMYLRVNHCGTRNMKTLMPCGCVLFIKNIICIVEGCSSSTTLKLSFFLVSVIFENY